MAASVQPCSDPAPNPLFEGDKSRVQPTLPTMMPDTGPYPLNGGLHAGHGKLGQGRLKAVQHGPPTGQKADTGLGCRAECVGLGARGQNGNKLASTRGAESQLSELGQPTCRHRCPCLSPPAQGPKGGAQVSDQMPEALHHFCSPPRLWCCGWSGHASQTSTHGRRAAASGFGGRRRCPRPRPPWRRWPC